MSIIPIDRKMKIQAKTPEMKIEFFTDDEIERMKIFIQDKFKNENKRFKIHRRILALLITLLRTEG
ncbi:MAG: hypothetical protein ACP5E8_06605, partial [Thermoplasmata archaeon]